jgi:signal transduction histidine kinase
MHDKINSINKITIFICCVIIYLCQSAFSINVSIILIGVIFSGFLSYFENWKIRTVLTVGFSVFACFLPVPILFLPLIAYDMIYNNSPGNKLIINKNPSSLGRFKDVHCSIPSVGAQRIYDAGKTKPVSDSLSIKEHQLYKSKYHHINLLGLIPLIRFINAAPIQIIIIVLVMLIFSILLRYRSEEQIRLNARNNQLIDAATEMSIQLKKQNTDLIEKQDFELRFAKLNERNRIAREIHDNVGHLLSSAILQAGALLSTGIDEKNKQKLIALKGTLDNAMNSVRASVHQLYDESIDLNAQIRNIICQFTFCDVSYDYTISRNPDRKLKYAFISIVKEALSNIIKHSDATHVSIVFREHPAIYQLIIQDNGTVKSFSTDEGLGLKNMADRVHSLNGNINIKTKNGFEIFISIPKEGCL